jgi:hypothetical protein
VLQVLQVLRLKREDAVLAADEAGLVATPSKLDDPGRRRVPRALLYYCSAPDPSEEIARSGKNASVIGTCLGRSRLVATRLGVRSCQKYRCDLKIQNATPHKHRVCSEPVASREMTETR